MPYRSISPHGTELLIDPIPSVRSCSVGFWVKRGSCWELPGEEGLAHFIEHTVFKGTAKFPEPQVMAEATDHLGGSLDAFTGKESACFYGKVLKEKLPDLVSILGDLVTTPTFDGEELARERKVILEEISQSEDQPDDWVSELFYSHFWPGSPLAHSILGRREQVGTYGRDEARAFFDKTYRAPNILIVAAGDIEVQPFLDLVQPVLEALPRGLRDDGVRPASGRPRPFVLNTPRKELQQTSLVLGFPAPPHVHPDRVAVGVLSHVLGGGMSSRLFMELREKNALCYQVGTYLTHYRDAGALQISASCAPERARELVRRAAAECAKVREAGITREELDRAKLQLRTNLVFSQESATSRMFSLAYQRLHTDTILSLDQQIAEIEEVSLDQVQRVAREVLDPGALGVSALGVRRSAGIRKEDLAVCAGMGNS
ncbi:M16 family metallopeptidase [Mesoterricola silvestris]|uniref:Peptidase M16 n=1 Tax=Mesoterricola silvestris TaxID=2927979 RepID=A0AA48H2Z4_9BACT|nr:pitrilysin family protein [Mesoterricola silvestris]BDU70968.1 peptidase M16 [Mesoterricola silvestris]